MAEELNMEVMEELETAAEPVKAKKAKKEPVIGPNQVGANDVAKILGIDPRNFRGFLRKNFRDMPTEKGQRYVWTKDSAELQTVLDAYGAFKTKKAEKAAKPAKAKEAKVDAAPAEDDSIDEIEL